ncbi:MAG: hypothetical protein U0938_13715 [Thiobacillus sp.]|nr:hypothetical protein [Thiobacillus sp.]
MAKKILPPAELTRLHRLTDDEANLIMDFRLLSACNKGAISYMCKTLPDGDVEPTAGNVVSIARRPD